MDRRRAAQWAPAVAAALAVLALSVVPGGGARYLGPFGLLGLDKWLHALAYAGVACLAAAGHGRADARALAAVAVVVTAYGGGVELVQGPLPSRSASGLDLVADAAGAALGVAAYRVAAVTDRLPAFVAERA